MASWDDNGIYPGASRPVNTDYSTQLDQMLAPYRAQAEKLTSPYATMRPDSWLAQQHPKVAGILDNAFLSAAMTPGPQGPEGVGGGISRTFQGMLGANQYRRQQMMMQAMLPYQMLEPRLKAEDTLAQIKQRDFQAQHQLDWYNHMSRRDDLLEQRNSEVKGLGQPYTSDKGNKFQDVLDPVSGKVTPQQVTGDKEDTPSFLQDRRRQADSSKTEVERMVDREEQAQVLAGKPPLSASERNAKIVDYSARMVGASARSRTQADQDILSPIQQAKSLVQNERERAYKNLQTPTHLDAEKPIDAIGFRIQLGISKELHNSYGTDPDAAYHKYLKDVDKTRQDTDTALATYARSKAPMQGIGLEEYKANPKMYDVASVNVQPQATSSGSSSNWTPK